MNAANCLDVAVMCMQRPSGMPTSAGVARRVGDRAGTRHRTFGRIEPIDLVEWLSEMRK